MTRQQRRAAARDQSKATRRVPTAGSLSRAKPLLAADPSRRYLTARMRPFTVADMEPGHEYPPGMVMLEVELPATADHDGEMWGIPIEAPPELRAATPENAQILFAFVYKNDPEARAIIDDMKRRARPWREVMPTAAMPRDYFGKTVLPPLHPAPTAFPATPRTGTHLHS